MSQSAARPTVIDDWVSAYSRPPLASRRTAMTITKSQVPNPRFQIPSFCWNLGFGTWDLFLECGHCLIAGIDDFADAVQADQVEDRARRPRDPAELQVAAFFRDALQARQDDAAAAAIHELHPIQVEHQLGAIAQHRLDLFLEIVGIAGIEHL